MVAAKLAHIERSEAQRQSELELLCRQRMSPARAGAADEKRAAALPERPKARRANLGLCDASVRARRLRRRREIRCAQDVIDRGDGAHAVRRNDRAVLSVGDETAAARVSLGRSAPAAAGRRPGSRYRDDRTTCRRAGRSQPSRLMPAVNPTRARVSSYRAATTSSATKLSVLRCAEAAVVTNSGLSQRGQ